MIDQLEQEQGSDWRFNKTRQIWVLKHLYDEERVEKSMFKKLVLPYVAGLQGGAREVSRPVVDALMVWTLVLAHPIIHPTNP